MPNNNGNFDLSGVFHVQQNYLTDLSNSYPDVNSAPLVASYVLDLQEKIKKNNDVYKSANTSANNILNEQNKMIDIVESETHITSSLVGRRKSIRWEWNGSKFDKIN